MALNVLLQVSKSGSQRYRLIFVVVLVGILLVAGGFAWYRNSHRGASGTAGLNPADQQANQDGTPAVAPITPTVIVGTIDKLVDDHLTLKNKDEIWHVQLLKDVVIQSDAGNAKDGPKLETKDRTALKKGQAISVTVTQITPGIELPALAVLLQSAN